MIHPKENYKSLKDINNIEDLAYFTIFEKYIKYKLKNEAKLIEYDSTDQEGLIVKKQGGYPIPGFIYTFVYRGNNFKLNNKEYTDKIPLIFCLNSEKEYLSGLNLNLLPPLVRLEFLSNFYDVYKGFLEREADVLAENNKLAINKKFISFAKSGNGQKIIRAFNSKSKSNFNFAFRKYNLKMVQDFRMIEYSEWKYIPFYNSKDAFRKINLLNIYKLYDQSKK